jgi:predicted ATP-dependent endonuclease of OLD family
MANNYLMKLTSFNIQNYRSIVHSGWCNLAHDNITALIGQNESGKTSVLEALHSFSAGSIHEDVLRSDLSLPIVSCQFEMEKGGIADLLENNRIPSDLLKDLESEKTFILTRTWKADRSSILFVSSEDILHYYEKKEVEKASIEEKTQSEIRKLLLQSEEIFREMELSEKLKNEAQQQLMENRKELDEAQKAFNKAKKPDEKLIAEKTVESGAKKYQAAEENFRKIVEEYELSKQKTQELSEKVSVCKACNTSIHSFSEITSRLDSSNALMKELEHQYEISSGGRDQKLIYKRLQQLQIEHTAISNQCQQAMQEESLLKIIAAKVLSGIAYRQAESEAISMLEQEKELYSIFDIGVVLFNHIPIFEFFEDFSSLLPNKIDLEDILNENSTVEGYKAARNFLQVAGLNAAFFREKNHRILKQKIENLNGEVTINFQDYWSQSVGKNNKIKLSFELEHYDYTHPEKSGKPYIEFWIKDKQERLYPKQRSRGVRWFLSFYLEIKATAKKNHVARVLLIDEPGLSLHARAQEDVLKVFEDIKESMQIIYCTHSPHLIDINKLYRILAVQRADEEDDRSETLILDTKSLFSASSDTLSPVYSHMGVKIHNQDFIQSKYNIIVEDTLAYYYLNAFCRLSQVNPFPSFIPSTGLINIPVLANILLGWKVGFSILLMGESRSDQTLDALAKSFFFTQKEEMQKRIIRIEEFEYPEDLFSTLDFKKFVLQQREGITEKNSDYIIEKGLSRTILASQFINYCEAKGIKIGDFDDKTLDNVRLLVQKIKFSIS